MRLKTLLATFTLPIALMVSTPSQAALEGDACYAFDIDHLAEYRCANVLKGQALTVNELYKRGYKIIATNYLEDKGRVIIFIEKQTD